jgi:hypothetical protein
VTIPASKKGRIFYVCQGGECRYMRRLEMLYSGRRVCCPNIARDPRKLAKTLFGNEAGAEEGVARLKTLRVEALAIPAIYGRGE